MSEALFRIPSRTVTYGYVEISVEGDFGLSPEALAAHYVNFVHAFQKEELATIERLKDAPSGALKAPLAASQPEVDHPVDPVDKAAQMVAEGLGGATYLGESEETDAPPWEAKVAATPKKPWETEATSSIAAARTVTLAENLDTPDW